MEVRDHPTHHRPVVIVLICLAAIDIALGIYFVNTHLFEVSLLGFLVQNAIAMGWVRSYCRQARCPGCKAVLARDKKRTGGDFLFTCPVCSIQWESKLMMM